jgi:bifunctional UDP-N-acetylglucosamine pyrophosphorylase/glucosamine-1-phosphate N-acetyltransferase
VRKKRRTSKQEGVLLFFVAVFARCLSRVCFEGVTVLWTGVLSFFFILRYHLGDKAIGRMRDVDVQAIVLAAGQGKRMRSVGPKVIQPLCGQPMIAHVIDAVRGAGVARIAAIVGHEAERVQSVLDHEIEPIVQSVRAGTGHAVLQAAEWMRDRAGDTLIVCGDTPLLTAHTLQKLVAHHTQHGNMATVLTAHVADPSGMGRIARMDGVLTAIVEDRDCTEAQRALREVNAGVYVFNTALLIDALPRLHTSNAQGEYYLTDVVEMFAQAGRRIDGVCVQNETEAIGVNDWCAMADAEAVMRARIAQALMRQGVRLIDPQATYVDVHVRIGAYTTVYPHTHIQGRTVIGERCIVGPNCTLTNCTVADDVHIQHSVLVDCTVGTSSTIGPFAYVRPGTVIADHVKVGDFVEVKNAHIGSHTKVPHHAYIGDTDVGAGTNIGCGVITANFNGVQKHRTVIGDRTFVGSNTTLVAPVTVGCDAIVAAGSTITEDVPDRALALSRLQQTIKEEYAPVLLAKWQAASDGARHGGG